MFPQNMKLKLHQIYKVSISNKLAASIFRVLALQGESTFGPHISTRWRQ